MSSALREHYAAGRNPIPGEGIDDRLFEGKIHDEDKGLLVFREVICRARILHDLHLFENDFAVVVVSLISTLRSLRPSATLRLYCLYSTLTAETQRAAENSEKISKVSHYHSCAITSLAFHLPLLFTSHEVIWNRTEKRTDRSCSTRKLTIKEPIRSRRRR